MSGCVGRGPSALFLPGAYNVVKTALTTGKPFLPRKTGRLGIRVMCRIGETCLPTDCCFSELEL